MIENRFNYLLTFSVRFKVQKKNLLTNKLKLLTKQSFLIFGSVYFFILKSLKETNVSYKTSINYENLYLK